MTQLFFEHEDRRWRIAVEHAIDLSIPLDFDGPQPGFFGAPRAHAAPLHIGRFVGDVRQGGSCRCDVVTLTPHCNGTHTECVGHVVDDPVAVTSVGPILLVACRLITVTPRPLPHSDDSCAGPSEPDDLVIDSGVLEPWLDSGALDTSAALVIRTLPNPAAKRARDWGAALPPYFTPTAIGRLAAARIDHLVVDLPSLDRADDGGRLAAHRMWWGLAAGSRRLADATRPHCTVTELAYIPDSVADGPYLLSLHVAPFVADAAPSRPILLPFFPD